MILLLSWCRFSLDYIEAFVILSDSMTQLGVAASAIRSAIDEERCCVTKLQAKSYFIAWNGVLCLMFAGYPQSLVRLKKHLNNEDDSVNTNNTSKKYRYNNWKKEGFGSKWPKVTLGFLKEGEKLSMKEFQTLKTLCQKFSRPGECASIQKQVSSSTPAFVNIKQISVVRYRQRGLESIDERIDIPLLEFPTARDVTTKKINEMNQIGSDDNASISIQEINQVESVYSEWNADECSYLEKVNQPGEPYRDGSSAGLTCVTFLNLTSIHSVNITASTRALETNDQNHYGRHQAEQQTLKIEDIKAFRSAVNSLLPGKYEWLEESSLHFTVRSLH